MATPHIAGYSMDGKANGTHAVYRAACRCFDVEPVWNPSAALPPPETPEISIVRDDDVEALLRTIVLAAYPIERDDGALRAVSAEPAHRRAEYFDALRRNYPARREFPATHIRIDAKPSVSNNKLAEMLRGLGFVVRRRKSA